MNLSQSFGRIELRDTPLLPWLFAAVSIPFGILIEAWAAGLVPSTPVPAAARIWLIVLGAFGIAWPLLMLRSFPRMYMVIDHASGKVTVDQWAFGRHASGEWAMSAVTAVHIARGLEKKQPVGTAISWGIELMLTDGTSVVPTPTWHDKETIEPAANAIGALLKAPVVIRSELQATGFPDRTPLSSKAVTRTERTGSDASLSR